MPDRYGFCKGCHAICGVNYTTCKECHDEVKSHA